MGNEVSSGVPQGSRSHKKSEGDGGGSEKTSGERVSKGGGAASTGGAGGGAGEALASPKKEEAGKWSGGSKENKLGLGQAKKSSPMEVSAASLGPSKPEKSRPSNTTPPDRVMITDALSDVRIKYHINPREIGHGHYGVVRKCMDRQTKEWYAIKSIRKSKVGKIEVLKREVAILEDVRHPSIIRFIEVHEDVKYLHLVTELCTGGELFDRIISKTQTAEGHFSERDAAYIIRSILDAIAYCHDVKQIVHRDLKP